MSRSQHNSRSTSSDDELLRVVERHLPALWKVQRHVGNVGLLSVLRTAERKLSERQEPFERQIDPEWSEGEGRQAAG